jgi:hypothetical protein
MGEKYALTNFAVVENSEGGEQTDQSPPSHSAHLQYRLAFVSYARYYTILVHVRFDANKRFRIKKANQLYTSSIRESSNNTNLRILRICYSRTSSKFSTSFSLFKHEYCVYFNKVLQFYVHFYNFLKFVYLIFLFHKGFISFHPKFTQHRTGSYR